jgi:hypothetical protein
MSGAGHRVSLPRREAGGRRPIATLHCTDQALGFLSYHPGKSLGALTG